MQLPGDSLILAALRARAGEIVRRARGRGLEASVALVDRDGIVAGTIGDEGESSREALRRARTSASLGMSTAELGVRLRGAAGIPGAARASDVGAGGVPLFLDGRLIGAVGLSGGDARAVAALAEALRLLARGEAASPAAIAATGVAVPKAA